MSRGLRVVMRCMEAKTEEASMQDLSTVAFNYSVKGDFTVGPNGSTVNGVVVHYFRNSLLKNICLVPHKGQQVTLVLFILPYESLLLIL